MPKVSVSDTGDAVARDGGAAVSGLSGPVPEPGTSVLVSQTGNATAAAGGNANTGYQHIDKLYVVQPPVTDPQPPAAPQIPGWVIPRADEMKEIVAAVLVQTGKAVGITTGLEGAGGFGKTMLAAMTCADKDVREHFEGRIYIATIGRDVCEPAAIATKVIETIRLITGHTVTYTDPGMAGDELGRLLDQTSRRILLVLDDVWDPAQLDPFLRGGKNCVRLVTTRVPAVLPDGAVRVRVDQMTGHQALDVLGQDLELLPEHEHLARDLITATGRWPLLLRLANRWMWRQRQAGADVATAAEHMLTLLREEGPAAVDRSRPPPDPADPAQRRRMVRATLQAATGLLTPGEQQCLAELGIFAEDEPVPVLVAARLWQTSAGLSAPRARDLCYELSSLSLLTLNHDGGGFLVLHDVIRGYLRHDLGSGRITQLNATLADAVAASLPAGGPLAASAACPRTAWWALAEDPADSYLADHLIAHLLAADRIGEAEATACDLRWVEARLHRQGPTAPWSDCGRIPTAAAERRARDLLQAAHLLEPTSPSHALTAVLHSRLEPLPQWRDQVTARQHQLTRPALRNHWPPPDLPNPALKRVLDHGRTEGYPAGMVMAVVAPDGSWLAASADDERVLIWDLATGRQTTALDCRGTGGTWAVAVAPDGAWLATGHNAGQVRIWDVATGKLTQVLKWHPGSHGPQIAVAPDGSWLADGRDDGQVRIWDVATGQQTMEFDCRPGRVWALAVAPDGSWLASGTSSVRIWDVATGQQIGELPVARAEARMGADEPWMVRVGPWLATGNGDGLVQVWDVASSQEIRELPGVGGAAVAATPDGTWLATSREGRVRVWNLSTGHQVRELRVAKAEAKAIAVAPDGTWLVTVGFKGRVQIWDLITRSQAMELDHRVLSGTNAHAVAVASDGTWLVTGHADGSARIWDVATGQQTMQFDYHGGGVEAVAVAPDGTWLATVCGWEGRVRIWDYASDRKIRELPHARARAMTVAPDGTWLATGHADGSARIWDPATGQQTRELPGVRASAEQARMVKVGSWFITEEHVVTALTVAPDGTWLATGRADGRVLIRDLATGQQTQVLDGRLPGAGALAVAPDGTWLATGHADGPVLIWDLATGQRIEILDGHVGEVTAVAVAPDGTRLATVGRDMTIRVWEKATGRVLTAMRVDGALYSCTWMPDGSGLVIGGHRGVYFFDFYPGANALHNGRQLRRTVLGFR